MLKQIQAATGAAFFLFLIAHLVNTWVAAFGAPAYDSLQSALRVVYQNLAVEALLLAALTVHLIVGVVRMRVEPRRQLNARARWHRYAGIFLAVFIVGHVLAVRGSSWFFDVYPGFSGLAFSVAFAPYYFYPYYFLLGLAGFYHGLNGLSIALPRLGVRLPVSTGTLKAGSLAAALLMALALLSLGGVIRDVDDPYQGEFARLAAELFDVDLAAARMP